MDPINGSAFTPKVFLSRPCVQATSTPPVRRPLFLPKYSPDLNPIERFFPKLKHWMRQAARRSPDAACDVIGEILKTSLSNGVFKLLQKIWI
jgi:transposase